MSPYDILRGYPLLALLRPRQLDAWLSAGQELEFATGETVFQEGSAGVWAYLVLAGRVRVLRTTASGREVSLGLVGTSEVFGEYALLPPHRNTAACRAAEPTCLLRLPLLPLRPVFAGLPGVKSHLKNWLRLHALLRYLRGQTFLGFLSAPSALKMLDRLQTITFEPGQTIQTDGLSDDRWYVIERGQVSLGPSPDEVGGVPGNLGPGDCFGERGLSGQEGLPVAVARTETCCQSLPRSAFAPALSHGPHPSLQSLSRRRAQLPVWIGQQDTADCGVAALAMVAQGRGHALSVDCLRREVRVEEGGASLLELQRAGAALGLRCQAVQVRPAQLGLVDVPFLAHLKDGHYVAVCEYGLTGVIVGDPASGVVRWSLEAFARACSGALLLVRPPIPISRG